MKPTDVISIRVSSELKRKLEKEAAMRGGNTSLSKVTTQIISDYFDDKWEKSLIEASFNSVGRIEKQLKQILGDNEAIFDFLSLFVFQWCCHLPEISNQQKQAQAIDGQKRYDEFISLLKKIRIERKSFAALILDELRQLYNPIKAA